MWAKIECHYETPMQTIIIADIFGRTAALERLATEISEDALILDPYDSEYMTFKNEEVAYGAFRRMSFSFPTLKN